MSNHLNVLNRTSNLNMLQDINPKKGIKTGMAFNTQNLIEQSHFIHGSAGSV